MVHDNDGGDEGRLAASRQNKAVGRALRAARMALTEGGSKQVAFAARLSRDLEIPVSSTAVSNWENGKRTVPGAVLVAAATAAGRSVDALLGESGVPEVVTWIEGLGLPQRLEVQDAELRSVRGELAELRQVVEALQAEHQVAGMDDQSARPIEAPGRSTSEQEGRGGRAAGQGG